MPPISKVDLCAAIRRDSRAGLSVRGLARKYQVSRRTVRSALSSAWPAPRKPLPPRPSKLDPFKPVIDDILRADLDAPRKQRHTELPASTLAMNSRRRRPLRETARVRLSLR
jgi:transposase